MWLPLSYYLSLFHFILMPVNGSLLFGCVHTLCFCVLYFQMLLLAAGQVFFCELVVKEKNKIEQFDPTDFSFIDNAVQSWPEEWRLFLP